MKDPNDLEQKWQERSDTNEPGAKKVVKLNYDIRSNTKPQTVNLRNTMNAREGNTVKVRVEKGAFSVRGSRPAEIIGVEWTY